jgi:hypothetical protein
MKNRSIRIASVAETFKAFLSNLVIDNADIISFRYGEITSALNQSFRTTESKVANSLQVGSYGRSSAIKGISDLDMLYFVPAAAWDGYKDGGQYRLLAHTSNAIKARYPTTEVFVDRLVVRVLYKDFHVEVQPVFEEDDKSFTYPDTKDGGSWKITKPRLEIAAMSSVDSRKNGNLRALSKMIRAWKNKHGVGMGGYSSTLLRTTSSIAPISMIKQATPLTTRWCAISSVSLDSCPTKIISRPLVAGSV